MRHAHTFVRRPRLVVAPEVLDEVGMSVRRDNAFLRFG